ncbi:MAG: 30S ribosomal protein S16 [Chloroflexi bacterium]|nr:30S ribosomal protein S16 [Chloroflexota bacterium]
MLRIRLRRVGAKNQPSFRIVVADSRAARDGAFVDHLGHYNPRTDPPTVVLDREKALKWISQGAQPSEAVQRMLDKLETPESADDK